MEKLSLYCTNEQLEYDTYLLVKEFFTGRDILRQNEDSDAFLYCDYKEGASAFRFADSGEKTELTYPVNTPFEDKKAFKRAHMSNLYQALHTVTKTDLPWGSLTGVRPTKFARQMIMAGKTEEEVRDFYRTDRFVSEEKTNLAIEIAKCEAGIIGKIDPLKGYSLYIGIPFCPSRCLYCSFLSNPIIKWQERVEEYLSCLEKELILTKELFAERPLNTIYIGGGTPTSLSAEELKILMDMIHRHTLVANTVEFTVEAGRPDSITKEKLRVLKENGVNRISVNPQTMNDETLRLIGRNHDTKQTIDAFLSAREEGFTNINMDIIIGLPGEKISHVGNTMEQIIKLAPDSLTVHSLALKRSAGMKDWMKEQNADTAFSDSPEEMMKIAAKGALELGLNPYYLYRQKNIAGNLENVGFSKVGKEGIYNVLMMEEVQTIVAAGAGTVSKKVLSEKEISRCDTAKDIGLYMDQIDEMLARKKELFS